MTPTDEEMKAVAEAATQGPWNVVEYGDGDSLVIHYGDEHRICFMATPGGSAGEWRRIQANATFIATFDPTAVLSLLDRLQKAEARAEALRAEAEQWAQEARTHKSSLHEAYQAVTGATGEPGNWNGARPIIEAFTSLRAERDGLREIVAEVVDEFGGSIDQYHKIGPDWTHKDGTETLNASTLMDREPLIERARAALANTSPNEGSTMNSSLDTSGAVNIVHEGPAGSWGWDDLSPFAQGYVEEMWLWAYHDGQFSTAMKARRRDMKLPGFSDLAPATLAAVLRDCEAFCARGRGAINFAETTQAGGRFWVARQTGFPQAGSKALCDAFPPLVPYLADDGLIYLRPLPNTDEPVHSEPRSKSDD